MRDASGPRRSGLEALDRFVPDSLRVQGADTLRRARFAVGGCFIGAMGAVWFTATQFLLGTAAFGWAAGAVALWLGLLPFLLRRTGSLRLLGHGMTAAIFLASVGIAALTGGEAVVALYVVMLVPLTAVLLVGGAAGVAWTAAIAACLTVVGLAADRGFDFPVHPAAEIIESSRIRGTVAISVITLALALTYEWLKNRAVHEVEEARAHTDAAHRRRRESEARFRALAENVSDAIAEWDAEGRLLYVSPRTRAQLGLDPEDLEPSFPADRVHPGDAPALPEALRRAASSRQGTEVSFRMRHRDGSWRWLEVTIQPFRDAAGELHLASVGRDVTDRREVEKLRELTRQLEETGRNLSRANRELEEFASVAAHDLQEPMRRLVSFSELLRDDLGDDLPAAAARDLELIGDGARRMQQLVRDLLELSRTSTDTMKRERVSAERCADRALERLELRVRESGARITRDPLPRVEADPTLLTLLYQNLIANALKFTARGKAPRIHLSAEQTAEGWVLGVRDQGIGVPPERAGDIFKPFTRLHAAEEYEGTGIGLAICRKAAERHGGWIEVESRPGRGAHFRFALGESAPR